MTRTWRLIRHEPAGGSWNMAVDEALIPSVEDSPVIRFYGWDEWTLSLGRFQDARGELLPSFLERPGFPVVRRMTGGGSILHGGELTYSLVLKQDDLGSRDVKDSFRLLCGFLLRFYAKLGLSAGFAVDGGIPTGQLGQKAPFCYAGKELYDILVGAAVPAKIGGNAQRRFRKVIFQHGSIPITLNRSALASIFHPGDLPDDREIVCLEELGVSRERGELGNLLAESFIEEMEGNVREDTLCEAETRRAVDLDERVYRSAAWTFDRTRTQTV